MFLGDANGLWPHPLRDLRFPNRLNKFFEFRCALPHCKVHGAVLDVLEHVSIFAKSDEPKLLGAESPKVAAREEAKLERLFAKQESGRPTQQRVVEVEEGRRLLLNFLRGRHQTSLGLCLG